MKELRVKDACELLDDVLQEYQTQAQKAVKIRKLLQEHRIGHYSHKRWKLDKKDIDRLRRILSLRYEGVDEYPYSVSQIAERTGKKNLTVRQQARKLNLGRFVQGSIRFTQQEFEQLRDYHPEIGTFQKRYVADEGTTVTQLTQELKPYFGNWSIDTLKDRIRKTADKHKIGIKDRGNGVHFYLFNQSDLDQLKRILLNPKP